MNLPISIARLETGDHGTNMRRGFEALLASVDELSAKNLGESLKASGRPLS